jgi:hypothetical protein
MNRFTPFALIVATVASVVFTFGLQARAPEDDNACTEGVVSRVYFGQTTPWGTVTEVQWQAFVAQTVTPRFPSGFTELRARGHWRDAPGSIHEEDTRVIEVAHDDSAPARARVRDIAAEYRRTFAQQSVLVTQAPALQCF